MNIRLEKIAKELLMEEDCVVIPNFGGFVTHYRPSIMEPSKNLLIPPGKSISFNAKLSKNDGLLAQNMAVKTGLTYNEALRAIDVKVGFWQKELSKSNYLELEGLGSFVQNKEGGLVFEQFNESNFANASFGLTNVHATPVERVGLTQRIERSLDKKKATQKVYKLVTRSAAAILLFGLIGFGGNEFRKTDMGMSLADSITSIFKSETVKVQEPVLVGEAPKVEPKALIEVKKKEWGEVITSEDVQEFKDLGHLDQPENLEKIREIQQEKEAIAAKFETEQVEEVIQNNSSNKYHVIAGCFGVKSNANKMVNKLKKAGFKDAQLAGLSKSGLHRVAYGSYNQKVAALKALAKAKLSHNSQAWLAED